MKKKESKPTEPRKQLNLIIDGMNFFHRGRAGFTLGDYPVVFNVFRNLRALVELMQPTRVIIALEGHPKKRHELLTEYKAQRRIVVPEGEEPTEEQTKKLAEQAKFFQQVSLVVDLLSKHFPVSVVRHPDHECDDTIANLIKRSSKAVQWTVVSNDSDFTQLLNEHENVRIYNPMAKEYVETPSFDYVTWKALRGDGSDNIPGLPGIGDTTADRLMSDPEGLQELFQDKAKAEQFTRNCELIRFMTWSNEEALQMTSSSPSEDWDAVAAKFRGWAFNSIIKEPSWTKFKATFEHLWSES